MKKIFTFAMALLSLFAVQQSVSALTYTTTVPAGTKACYIVGGMNGWSASANPMTKVDDTHFSIDLPNAKTTDEYKYCSGPDWKYEECDAQGVKLTQNRVWAATDIVANWIAFYDTALAKDVKIEVLVPSNVKVCYITGSFNGWSSPTEDYIMTKGETTVDGIIYSKTIHSLDTTTLEYKFLAGPAWAYEQLSPSGNFIYKTDGATVVVAAFKAYYDPEKTGTINITATVPAGTNKVWIMGDFLGWNMANAVEGTKNNDGTFSFSIPLVMSIEYRLYNLNDWAYPEVGQADPTKDLANRTAVYPADANLSIAVWGWKQAASSVPEISADKYNIKSTNHIISVEGVTSKAELFDVSGRLLQSEKIAGTFTSKTLKSGIYILFVDGATKKVAVK